MCLRGVGAGILIGAVGTNRTPMINAKPSYFDILTGDNDTDEDTPARAAFQIDLLAIAAELNPVWRLDATAAAHDDAHVAVLERGPGWAAILMVSGEWRGVLWLRVGEGGWVEARVESGGATVFSALVDRPYEELELRPNLSHAVDPADPPGRMGKRMNWLSLSTTAWPTLAPIAAGGWFNAEAVEDLRE